MGPLVLVEWGPWCGCERSPVCCRLVECGPWCGCERARCQNRLAQRGVRVRLQVFQGSAHGGWGVRCRDDLDQGTFICTYAGKRSDPPSLPLGVGSCYHGNHQPPSAFRSQGWS